MAFRTREQERAQRAWERVSAHCGRPEEGEYRSFALRFPAMVYASGLCQALAFAMAKNHTLYMDDLVFVTAHSDQNLASAAQTADLREYMRLTRDVVAAASWLKRWAEALLREDGKKDAENDGH